MSFSKAFGCIAIATMVLMGSIIGMKIASAEETSPPVSLEKKEVLLEIYQFAKEGKVKNSPFSVGASAKEVKGAWGKQELCPDGLDSLMYLRGITFGLDSTKENVTRIQDWRNNYQFTRDEIISVLGPPYRETTYQASAICQEGDMDLEYSVNSVQAGGKPYTLRFYLGVLGFQNVTVAERAVLPAWLTQL